jgi:transposase InsO family protein
MQERSAPPLMYSLRLKKVTSRARLAAISSIRRFFVSSWSVLLRAGLEERFMRTLKEQCLYLHQFRELAEARAIIGAFIERYNTEWIVERLGYRTPAQARRDALQEAA